MVTKQWKNIVAGVLRNSALNHTQFPHGEATQIHTVFMLSTLQDRHAALGVTP